MDVYKTFQTYVANNKHGSISYSVLYSCMCKRLAVIDWFAHQLIILYNSHMCYIHHEVL